MWQSAAPLVGKPKVGKLSRGLVGRVHSNIPPPPHGSLVHGGDVPPLHGRSEASSSAAASAPPFPHPRPCPRRHSPRPSRGGVVHGGGLPPPRGYTRLLRGLLRCGRPARTPHRPTIPSAFSSENPARRILARTYCTSTSTRMPDFTIEIPASARLPMRPFCDGIPRAASSGGGGRNQLGTPAAPRERGFDQKTLRINSDYGLHSYSNVHLRRFW